MDEFAEFCRCNLFPFTFKKTVVYKFTLFSYFRLWLQFCLKLKWNILISKTKHGKLYQHQYRQLNQLVAILQSLLGTPYLLLEKHQMVTIPFFATTLRVMHGIWSNIRAVDRLTIYVSWMTMYMSLALIHVRFLKDTTWLKGYGKVFLM